MSASPSRGEKRTLARTISRIRDIGGVARARREGRLTPSNASAGGTSPSVHLPAANPACCGLKAVVSWPIFYQNRRFRTRVQCRRSACFEP